MQRWCGGLGFVLAIAWSSAAYGNGHKFFAPAGMNGPIDLVYFGTIADRQSGRPLDFADVTVSAATLEMTFPFSNDRPGHYRSPDIGVGIKAAGELVDTGDLEIVCYVEGYKPARRSVPRRRSGTIEVSFLMEKDGPPGVVNAAEGPVPHARSWRVPTLGLFLIALSAGVAHTSSRRRSTAR